jgi:hypothetical protein
MASGTVLINKPSYLTDLAGQVAQINTPSYLADVAIQIAEFNKPSYLTDLASRVAQINTPSYLVDVASRLAEFSKPSYLTDLASRAAQINPPSYFADVASRIAQINKPSYLAEAAGVAALNSSSYFADVASRVAQINSAPNLKNLISAVSGIESTLQALLNADDSTLAKVAKSFFVTDGDADLNGISGLVIADFAELDSALPASVEDEVASALAGDRDLSSLSSRANDLLKFALWAFLLIVNYLAIQNGVREELCYLQPKLMPALTIGQTGKAIRTAICQAEMPEEMLRNYRLVKGNGVRLRTEPAMKSEVVQVTLADRALLEVLDSTNRDWLLVAIVGEEGVSGWVSRKYTHPLMR